MGRIVVTEFVSLDGVMEDPGGAEGFKHAGWTFRFNRGAEGDRFKLDELERGRGTAPRPGHLRGLRPGLADHGRTRSGFADRMNSMPKYVVSTTLRDEDADLGELDGDQGRRRAASSRRCKKRLAGRPPGRRAARRWCRRSSSTVCVDEIRLMVFPIVLGTGKRLFGRRVGAADPGAGQRHRRSGRGS